MELEKKVLTTLVSDATKLNFLVQRKITEKYFMYPECSKLFQILKWHYDTYVQNLESDSLQAAFRLSTSISSEAQAKIAVLFEEVKLGTPVTNFELLLDEFVQYHKSQILSSGVSTLVDKLQEKDVEAAIRQLRQTVSKLDGEELEANASCVTIGDDADRLLFEYFDKKEHPEKYRGVHLGFPSFDKQTNGLRPGHVMLIAGEMKAGKSVLGINISKNVVDQGKRVYYHANEGGANLVEERYISCATGISITGLTHNNLVPVEEQIFKDYLAKLKTNQNFIIDNVNVGSTPGYIRAQLQRVQVNGPIDLVIVDYFGLMEPDLKISGEADHKTLGRIAWDLKKVAAQMNVPMIVLAHVNRKGMESSKKKKSYELEDFGLSLEPLKHVDMIAFWKIVDPDTFELAHMGDGSLYVKGSRHSPAFEVVLQVNTNKMLIEEQQHFVTVR